MKQCIQLLIFLLLSCITISCASRKSEPVKGKTFTAKNEAVKQGEQVFMKYCQKCHPAGEAGLGPALNANPAPAFIKRFQMRHGLGVMPGFTQDEISKEDLHHITDYLRALKQY
ncbi:MAG TPA: cytochrome c [Ohtaekwangia sp.]|nr:cytochrome c [Ohtaekwangia sp.]